MSFKLIKSASVKIAINSRYNNWFSKHGLLLLMALPFIAFVTVFSYVPLFGWIYAFYDYHPGVSLAKSTFVGFKYFQMALDFRSGSELLLVLRNTFALSFLSILLSPLTVIFAIFLNEMKSAPFKKLIQTTTTLPNFISWVLVYSIAFATFSINDGFINQLLMQWNLIQDPINPLGNGSIAWYFQTALGIWKGLGFGSIIYLAAINGIDTELYDAADVDGAGRFHKILHITIPGVAPTYLVMLLLSVSNILTNGFDQYYSFMNAMVQTNLQVFDYYVYRIGLALNEYSYSTALGIFKSVVSITLLFSVNWIAKRSRGESII
jgi:putative aldouronate transport system permease protein